MRHDFKLSQECTEIKGKTDTTSLTGTNKNKTGFLKHLLGFIESVGRITPL